MKAFIYNSQSAAAADNLTCKPLLNNLSFSGDIRFSPENQDMEYSTIIIHPTSQQWALIADADMEALLNKQAVELDSTWRTEPVV